MNRPRLSVVTYLGDRPAAWLERTICSVLDQDEVEIDCFVAHDGPLEEAACVTDYYGDELGAVDARAGWTPAEAIGASLARTRGDLVAVINAGDLYLPGALETVARAWCDQGGPSWLLGRVMHIGNEDQLLGRAYLDVPASLAEYLRHDCSQWPMAACFWDRRFLEVHGPLNRDFRVCYDYEFWCRLLAGGERPRVVRGQDLVAQRQLRIPRSAAATLREGLEAISVAALHSHDLGWVDRCSLWLNVEKRRRIYALAEAELHGRSARSDLVIRAMRHPWWLADDAFRRMLLHGIEHPVPADMAA